MLEGLSTAISREDEGKSLTDGLVPQLLTPLQPQDTIDKIVKIDTIR
jgi:hypothetical protein